MTVPCNGCRLCCINDLVRILPHEDASQWHGIRSIVEIEGRRDPIEARETVREIEQALSARNSAERGE